MFLYFTYQLVQIFTTLTELMYLVLNKLASKVCKKNCPSFLYIMYKAGRKLKSFSHCIHSFDRFSFVINATKFIHSFFKQVCFF